MAFILKQIHFFNYTEIEELGDLERLKLVFEGIDDEELMKRIDAKRKNGRDDYPVRVMWNLYIAMIVFGHKTIASFRRELSRNSQLRRISGLEDGSKKKHLVPPARVFTNFLKSLEEEQDAIDNIFMEQVSKLQNSISGFGEALAGDGKYLDSYSKGKSKEVKLDPDNRTEKDAEWSTKEYHYTDANGNKKTKKEHHYGFRAHIICDIKTELPVAFTVTAANVDEKKQMKILLQNLPEPLKERAKFIALDRGYDSKDLITTIKNMGINPVVDIRNCWKDGEETHQYKNTDIVYDYRGNVYYVNDAGKKEKMKYQGYDCQKNCLRYSYNDKIYKIYISYDERIFLPIARDSQKFKKLYNGRTSVERLNGRLDRDYMFEEHCIRGLNKMKVFLSLSLIIMNGMAIGKVNQEIDSIRSIKTLTNTKKRKTA